MVGSPAIRNEGFSGKIIEHICNWLRYTLKQFLNVRNTVPRTTGVGAEAEAGVGGRSGAGARYSDEESEEEGNNLCSLSTLISLTRCNPLKSI